MQKWFKTYWVDVVVLSAIVVMYFVYHPPELVFSTEPSSGGDTGSHYWPLKVLKEELWDKGLFQVKAWNAGNLGGEPLFVHYFPFPFMLMALLGYLMPLPTAFNLGTILGPLTFPLSIYLFLRLIGFKKTIPVWSAIFSLFLLYDESYSIYGVNINSTLAGQFCHIIALNLFLVGCGFLYREINHKKPIVWSTIFFTLVGISHAYVFLMIPVFQLCILLLNCNLKVFKILVFQGLFLLGISAWFFIPMIHNQEWTTPLRMFTYWHEIRTMIFSAQLRVLEIALVLALVINVFLLKKIKLSKLEKDYSVIFLVVTLVSVALFFIYPYVGLVAGRAIPQLVAFMIPFVGILMGRLLPYPVIALIAYAASAYYIDYYMVTVKGWARWNYSSWVSKAPYENFKRLNNELRGHLWEPRVAFEHNMITNQVGTVRAFEMLPYFANRSTTESLYTQSTILGPIAFYLQSKYSVTPSCPFGHIMHCEPYNLAEIEDKLRLMGVGSLIVITDEVQKQANEQSYLIKRNNFEPWYLYDLKEPVHMVKVLKPNEIMVSDHWEGWRTRFDEWFRNYKKGNIFELLADNPSQVKLGIVKDFDCSPQVRTHFNGIVLETNCPGAPHLLKFAYHPTFKSNTGDQIYLISPGYMMILPSQRSVSLLFGDHWLWTLSEVITTFFSLMGLIYIYRSRKHVG